MLEKYKPIEKKKKFFLHQVGKVGLNQVAFELGGLVIQALVHLVIEVIEHALNGLRLHELG